MIDMSSTTAPKSDQLNADDLIGGPRTITITKVTANLSAPEQPISIYFEGDAGKPYKPCKSMRRVMIQVWGNDASQYGGRSMTLYRDPETMFGSLKVGGSRISHMSNIDGPMVMALTATKGNKKAFTVKPLKVEAPQTNTDDDKHEEAETFIAFYIKSLANVKVRDAMPNFTAKHKQTVDAIRADFPDLADRADAALSERLSSWDSAS